MNLSGALKSVNNKVIVAKMISHFYQADAARNNKTEIIKSFIQKNQNIDTVDSKGFSPLILAVYNGHMESVKLLIEAGDDVNLADRSGNTALMGAIFKGETAISSYLMKDAKANVN